MPADGQERHAGDGSFSMSADVQRQDRRKIVQHALRCTKARQVLDHAACWQIDRGRAADGSYSMPADGQGQDSRLSIQHSCRWTGAGQQMDHTACRKMNRRRAGMDRKSRTGDGTGSRQTDRSRGGQIDSTYKGRQMMLHAAAISDTHKNVLGFVYKFFNQIETFCYCFKKFQNTSKRFGFVSKFLD